MFHSETLARVIHADRVRDLDRAAEARRLLATAEVAADLAAAPIPEAPVRARSVPATAAAQAAATATCRPAARDGSAGVAA